MSILKRLQDYIDNNKKQKWLSIQCQKYKINKEELISLFDIEVLSEKDKDFVFMHYDNLRDIHVKIEKNKGVLPNENLKELQRLKNKELFEIFLISYKKLNNSFLGETQEPVLRFISTTALKNFAQFESYIEHKNIYGKNTFDYALKECDIDKLEFLKANGKLSLSKTGFDFSYDEQENVIEFLINNDLLEANKFKVNFNILEGIQNKKILSYMKENNVFNNIKIPEQYYLYRQSDLVFSFTEQAFKSQIKYGKNLLIMMENGIPFHVKNEKGDFACISLINTHFKKALWYARLYRENDKKNDILLPLLSAIYVAYEKNHFAQNAATTIQEMCPVFSEDPEYVKEVFEAIKKIESTELCQKEVNIIKLALFKIKQIERKDLNLFIDMQGKENIYLKENNLVVSSLVSSELIDEYQLFNTKDFNFVGVKGNIPTTRTCYVMTQPENAINNETHALLMQDYNAVEFLLNKGRATLSIPDSAYMSDINKRQYPVFRQNMTKNGRWVALELLNEKIFSLLKNKNLISHANTDYKYNLSSFEKLSISYLNKLIDENLLQDTMIERKVEGYPDFQNASLRLIVGKLNIDINDFYFSSDKNLLSQCSSKKGAAFLLEKGIAILSPIQDYDYRIQKIVEKEFFKRIEKDKEVLNNISSAVISTKKINNRL